MANFPHRDTTRSLTSVPSPWSPHTTLADPVTLLPVGLRSPTNACVVGLRAFMLGCHADSFTSSGSPYPWIPPAPQGTLQRQGAQWQVAIGHELWANEHVLQASAGVVDGTTPRMSASATPVATRAWSWSTGASTRRILHTNPSR